MQDLVSKIVILTGPRSVLVLGTLSKTFRRQRSLLLCHFPLLSGPPLCNEHYDHDFESVNSNETGFVSLLLPD